jgi:hypothetical protein
MIRCFQMTNATVSDTEVSFPRESIVQTDFRIKGWPAQIRPDSTTFLQNSK